MASPPALLTCHTELPKHIYVEALQVATDESQSAKRVPAAQHHSIAWRKYLLLLDTTLRYGKERPSRMVCSPDRTCRAETFVGSHTFIRQIILELLLFYIHPRNWGIGHNMKDLKIVIVGGGIGGLSAALALAADGHQIDLFESAKSFENVCFHFSRY